MGALQAKSHIMQKIKFLFATCAAGAVLFASSIQLALAAQPTIGTIVPGGDMPGDVVWTKEGSPYILSSSVNITAGHSLTIEAGSTVLPANNRDDFVEIAVLDGSLNIYGTPNSRVSIGGIDHLRVVRSAVKMNNADIRVLRNTYLYGSNATISSSTFSTSNGVGLSVSHTDIVIDASTFRDNGFADITVRPAFDDRYRIPSVTIKNSRLFGTGGRSIENTSSRIQVNAENNWWGDPDAPSSSSFNVYGGKVYGNVSYTPWLTSDPLSNATATECCSSVLFIPGLQGTRLFAPEDGLTKAISSSNRLWEANSQEDVRSLYLDDNGNSLASEIYSGDPIDKAYGLKGIYGNFMSYLDGLKDKDIIGEWKAFGYDWRKPIDEVVVGLEKKATGTESLIDAANSLAERSKTGRITLVTHSNGGLVGKYLVKKLEDVGRDSIIDSVISVAVPFLGTPEAILGLLHGDGQSIAAGLLVSESVARGLGKNMASAYSLLPSREYFKKILSPSIVFASTTVSGLNDGSYPMSLDSYEEQVDFIGDSANARPIAAFDDVSTPIKGNDILQRAAGVIHEMIDNYTWPNTMTHYAIVGMNALTAKDVLYGERKFCLRSIIGLECKDRISHERRLSWIGDGTVVSPSASDASGQQILLDLDLISREEGKNIRHANILESSTTEAMITKAITKESMSEILDLPAGVSLKQPSTSQEPAFYYLSTHSPVELHVYDKDGNHTGLIPKSGELESNDYVSAMYETEISGSEFGLSRSDDGDETSIYLPAESLSDYRVSILGTDFGFATFDIKRVQGDIVSENAEFSMFAVTPFTEATTNITQIFPKTLDIDEDGNGSIDIVASPNPGGLPDPSSSQASLRKALLALLSDEPRAQGLLSRLDHIVEKAKDGKLKQSSKQADSFKKSLGHIKLKGMSDEEREAVLDLIEGMLKAYEN